MLLERIYDEDLAQASYFIGCQAKGEALVTYTRTDGKTLHVLVWGGVDAKTPDPIVPSVPMTPTRPVRVVAIAVRTAGPITSTTGTS